MTCERLSRHRLLAQAAAWLLAGLALAAAAAEQTLYRSTDASGATTYSDRPPPEAVRTETVEVPPPPSAEAVEASRQRATRQRELADELSGERDAKHAEQEAAKRARRAAPTPTPTPTPATDVDGPYYGYPYHPRPPYPPTRPRYPYEWEGSGDHPAFRPPGQRPKPPAKPASPPAGGGIVKP
jgi:hypothetical protein